MFSSPGDLLLEHSSRAKKEILLAAPFIKFDALKRILDSVPSSVETITCVVRWRPTDIVAGVSDLEIFDLINDRGQLRVHPMLHAKIYRSDTTVLLGSANITQTALGWRHPANVETLVVDASNSSYTNFIESTIINQSVVATEEMRLELSESVEKIKNTDRNELATPEDPAGTREFDRSSLSNWLPLCPRPSDLYLEYSGTLPNDRLASVKSSAQKDLGNLDVPEGLPRILFNSFIRSLLLDMPITRSLSNKAVDPIELAQGKLLIADSIRPEHVHYPLEDHWKVLCDWWLEFCSDTFRRPFGSDSIIKGSQIA